MGTVSYDSHREEGEREREITYIIRCVASTCRGIPTESEPTDAACAGPQKDKRNEDPGGGGDGGRQRG